MSEPFLGEIRMVGFNYAPQGWLPCDGRLLQIASYSALFALLGTMYGGNGSMTFGLPDLRGRVPIDVGPGFSQGQTGGEAAHSLTTVEMPAHAHTATATTTLKGSSSAANSSNPQNTVPASTGRSNIYQTGAADVDQAASAATTGVTVANTGSGQAHNNLQPYQVVNFIIATEGIFPSRP
jgi:microcystin-dependent protein